RIDSANQSGPTGRAGSAIFGGSTPSRGRGRSPGQVLCMKLHPPPGTPTLPVIAARKASARQGWEAVGWCEVPALQKIAAGFAAAYGSATERIVSAGTSHIPAAHSGV